MEKKETNKKKLPKVTIGIPVLNEEEHIERVISGFLNTKYSNLVEVLIADGGSSDKTREKVTEYSKKDPRVKLIDNPKKFQSFSLNKMIEIAEGEIFLRADGHCFYADDYVERCVEVILKTGAKNVGGAQRYKAGNRVQAGIALAVKSYLGNGGAKYMDEQYSGYADTVFLGCFWTKDLREIEGFNTENITNEDSELNLRLTKKFGDAIYISSNIKSWYFPRSTLLTLLKQYFRYGRGRFLTRTLHSRNSPARGVIPFLFLTVIILYIITDIVTPINLYSLIFICLLVSIVIIESLRVSLLKRKIFKNEIWYSEEDSPSLFSNIISVIISLVLMQLGHFFGFLYQLLKRNIFRRQEW